MKKIIATLTLVVTFTIGASAQTKPLTSIESAKSDTAKLSELVQLTTEQQSMFDNLFEIKYNHLNDEKVPQGRKEELVTVLPVKIKAMLTEEQFNKLNANPALFKNLTGENIVKVPMKKE